MVGTGDNPYRSPSDSGSKLKSYFARSAIVVLHALVTLNWGCAVAWLYSRAMKPGYPLVDTSPPVLFLYVKVSFFAALLFLPVPLVLTMLLILTAKARPISLSDLGICLLTIALSGLTIWLVFVVKSPPIHAL